jgi:riboflavin synthase
MFSGIIEESGKVIIINKDSKSAKIEIEAGLVTEDLNIGDSVAVNGVCLTIVEFSKKHLTAEVMHETLEKTSIRTLKPGDVVNLERALKADGRFGGHIVTGHVDGTGTILVKRKEGIAEIFDIAYPLELKKYIAKKGSVAIDGISLTVVEINNDYFKLSLIPHSLKMTTLGFKKAGDIVNIEIDVLARYIENLFTTKHKEERKPDISEKFLIENGFM